MHLTRLFPTSVFAVVVISLMLIVLLAGCHSGRDDGRTVGALSVNAMAVQYRGDMDNDGLPSVSDAIAILRIVVGLDAFDGAADADGDGSVGVNDAIAVLRCVVGLDEWPLGVWEMPPTGTLAGVVVVDEFIVGADERIECTDDVTVQCQTATISGEVYGLNADAPGGDGVSVTIEAQGDVTVTGLLTGGEGADGSETADGSAGGAGGSITITSANGSITIGSEVSGSSASDSGLRAGDGGDGSTGLNGGAGGTGGSVTFEAENGTLTIHQSAGLIRLGNGGDGGDGVIIGDDMDSHEPLEEPVNGGGASGDLLIAAGDVQGVVFTDTGVVHDGLPVWMAVFDDGTVDGGRGGDGGSAYYGVDPVTQTAAFPLSARASGGRVSPSQTRPNIVLDHKVQGSAGGVAALVAGNGGDAFIWRRPAAEGKAGSIARAVGGGGGGVAPEMEQGAERFIAAAGSNRLIAGDGGNAEAIAGDGGAGSACGDGRPGGEAWADGGVGGGVSVPSTAGLQIGPGRGGNAEARGGHGGEGGGCCAGPTPGQGGRGGKGGNATSRGGHGGTVLVNWQTTMTGTGGDASAVGGNGGRGGNGAGPGAGGKAGTVYSVGGVGEPPGRSRPEPGEAGVAGSPCQSNPAFEQFSSLVGESMPQSINMESAWFSASPTSSQAVAPCLIDEINVWQGQSLALNADQSQLWVGTDFDVRMYPNPLAGNPQAAFALTPDGGGPGGWWPESIWLDEANNVLYATDLLGKKIYAWDNASAITANRPADRTINVAPFGPTGMSGGGAGDHLFLTTNQFGGPVLVFDNASTIDGAVAADRQITGLSAELAVAYDPVRDVLYTTSGDGRINITDNASQIDGDATGSRLVSGAATGLQKQLAVLQVFPSSNALFVAEFGGRIFFFTNASTMQGNVAPAAVRNPAQWLMSAVSWISARGGG